LPDRLF